MSNQTAISVQVELTPADIYRFSRMALFRRFRWFLMIVVPAVILVICLNVLAGQWDWSWQNLLGPVFLFVFVPYGFLVSPYFAARKYLRKNPNVVGPMSYVFSESGIDVSGPHAQGHVNWEGIVQVQETAAQFLFYPQTAIAHVIPKRFLSDPEQQAGLRVLARTHVKKATLRR